MRYVGEEYKFGLGCFLELFVELFLLVAFVFEEPVLHQKFFLVAASLPESAQEEKAHAEEQDYDGNGCVEQRGLRGMLRPVVVDLGFEELHFVSFVAECLVLEQEDVGVGKVHGR